MQPTVSRRRSTLWGNWQRWTKNDVDYDGDIGSTEQQKIREGPGTLDIWIGGTSNAALKRVARYDDG